MKYIILILILIITINPLQAQMPNHKALQKDWIKITIVDAYAYSGEFPMSGFSNKYEIKKEDLLIVKKSRNQQDSIVKKIKLETIDSLFKELNNDHLIPDDPLSRFRKDSIWLINNAAELWKSYYQSSTHEIDSVAIETLKNYTEIKEVAERLQYDMFQDDHRDVELKIIGVNDTLEIYSDGQYPFMLPWIYRKGGIIYNSRISEIVASFLPDIARSNKNLLLGEDFNHVLIDGIYRFGIKDKVELIKARDKHPTTFEKIENYYQIMEAEIVDMSSLSWGGRTLFARCLELKLQDTSIAKNVYFEAILGKRFLLYPVRPLLKFKQKVIKRLENNPVYQYTLKHKNSEGSITFVNSKSLSKQAKKFFLEDAKEQNLNLDNINLKNAILYHLSEERNDKSYSRWLFLEDNTLILWRFRGDFLMNLPEETIKEEGDICKIIDATLIR